MKTIDNLPTIWPREKRTLWQRLVRFLYKEYVNEAYFPRPTKIELVRERQKTHPRFGQVTHLVFHGPGYAVNGTYIHGQFGTVIEEHRVDDTATK